MPGYVPIMREVLGRMFDSNLSSTATVHLFTVGDVGEAHRAGRNAIMDMPMETMLVERHAGPLDLCEFPTLEALRAAAKASPDTYYLYLHTKGVATPDSPCIDDWRRYMTYFLVERWKDCVKALEDHDTVGVDWRTDYSPHYSGNFWWARGDYLAKLKPPREIPVVITERHKCEFWIGTGEGRHLSLHDCGIPVLERHLHRYPTERYIHV